MQKFKSLLAVLTLSFFIICSSQLGTDMGTKAYAKTKSSAYTVKKAKVKSSSKKSKKAKVTKRKVTTAKKTATAKKKTNSKTKKAAKTTKKKTTKKVAKKPSYSSSRKITSSRSGRIAYSSATAGKLISYAKKYLGVKYVFGGSSSRGFDCSGFTMYVYKSIGVSLPHTATGQSKMGRPVGRNELKPGDLVFFETYKKGISHVGIYIGNGSFIEASSSRGIAITSLSSSYYAPRYRGAVRILQ